MPNSLLSSAEIDRTINDLLLSGRARTADEAEELFLDESLEQIATLAAGLRDAELPEHGAIRLLMSRGSRTWEDGML